MKRLLLAVGIAASTAGAQDSSYSELRLRAAVLRNPIMGRIADDWTAGTGGEVRIATNVGISEVGVSVGHLRYTPRGNTPPYAGTLFSLGVTVPIRLSERLSVAAGVRLTDYRMDIDDPSLVGGLTTEEEVMPAAVGHLAVRASTHWSVVSEASYGVLMLSTRTPMLFVAAGLERRVSTPSWLRTLLR